MVKLTARQEATMKKHKVHHTAKHMKDMRSAMESGKTFTQAHIIAKKKQKNKK
tara:strand:+ start:2162 stop:2320 length:159 start_codon:yes stop_codon:yes gene_type:complete